MDSANIFNAIEMKSSPALEIAEKKIGTNLFHVNLLQIDVIWRNLLVIDLRCVKTLDQMKQKKVRTDL